MKRVKGSSGSGLLTGEEIVPALARFQVGGESHELYEGLLGGLLFIVTMASLPLPPPPPPVHCFCFKFFSQRISNTRVGGVCGLIYIFFALAVGVLNWLVDTYVPFSLNLILFQPVLPL